MASKKTQERKHRTEDFIRELLEKGRPPDGMEFFSIIDISKYLGYSYGYTRTLLAKYNLLEIFQKHIYTIKCTGCDKNKTIPFRLLKSIHPYLERQKRPFCSRACYYSYLKKERTKGMVNSYYHEHTDRREWPRVYFGRRPNTSTTPIVLYCQYKELLSKGHKPKDIISFFSRTLSVSSPYIKRQIGVGRKWEEERGYPFQGTMDIKNLLRYRQTLKGTKGTVWNSISLPP